MQPQNRITEGTINYFLKFYLAKYAETSKWPVTFGHYTTSRVFLGGYLYIHVSGRTPHRNKYTGVTLAGKLK